jgi:hypothetical protein
MCSKVNIFETPKHHGNKALSPVRLCMSQPIQVDHVWYNNLSNDKCLYNSSRTCIDAVRILPLPTLREIRGTPLTLAGQTLRRRWLTNCGYPANLSGQLLGVNPLRLAAVPLITKVVAVGIFGWYRGTVLEQESE